MFRVLALRSDEGLTLETPPFQISHNGNPTFMNSIDKTKFLFHSPTDAETTVSLEIRNQLFM